MIIIWATIKLEPKITKRTNLLVPSSWYCILGWISWILNSVGDCMSTVHNFCKENDNDKLVHISSPITCLVVLKWINIGISRLYQYCGPKQQILCTYLVVTDETYGSWQLIPSMNYSNSIVINHVIPSWLFSFDYVLERWLDSVFAHGLIWFFAEWVVDY